MKAVINHARIAGICAAVPRTIETVLESGYRTEDERIRFAKSTGIEQRRIASPGQCTSDLACAAGEKLLDELGWSRDDIDLLVFVTQSPDWIVPATAITLQDRLGLSKGCAAFDINLGCSGYTYGLALIGGMIEGVGVGKGLLLVGDTGSAGVLPSQRGTKAPLFGDAGAATALERSSDAATMYADLQSDGSGYEAIIHRRGAGRTRFGKDVPAHEILEDGTVAIDTGFSLDGPAILNFSAREVPPAVRDTLDFAGIALADVDYFVFHQANRLINELVRKKLGIDKSKAPSTLEEFGNTSSATIPLTIVHRLREEAAAGRLRLLLCGFGAGLSWGTVVCETDRIVCPAMIET